MPYAAATRPHGAGCEKSDFYQSPDDRGQLVYVAAWASKTHLDDHYQRDAFKEFSPRWASASSSRQTSESSKPPCMIRRTSLCLDRGVEQRSNFGDVTLPRRRRRTDESGNLRIGVRQSRQPTP